MADNPTIDLLKKRKPKQMNENIDSENGSNLGILEDGIGELNLGTRKKRPKKEDIDITEEEIPVLDLGIGFQNLIDARKEWPDYTYGEALDFIFQLKKEKDPNYENDKKRFVMKPPIVEKAASRKTSFSNFLEICRCLKRCEEHVLKFILAELGTMGSIDKNNCLIVTGKFQSQHFENVIRMYIKEYVLCHTCKSPETELNRETRLTYLLCNTCGSKCSVAVIRSGFKAVVGRRSAIRLATAANTGN